MPIRFRCSYCNRLLGIATRKAGMQTTCPHCGNSITVPIPNEDEGKTERINLDDVDALLGKTSGATIRDSAVAVPPAPPVPSPPPAYHSAAPTAPFSDAGPTQEVIEPEFEEPLSLSASLPPSPTKRASVPAKPQAGKTPTKAKAPPPSPAPKPAPKPKPKKPFDPNDPPLFENDVDDILGETKTPEAEEREKPPPTSGIDAMNLGETAPHHITISSMTATLLLAGVALLVVLAFLAGYYMAPRG